MSPSPRRTAAALVLALLAPTAWAAPALAAGAPAPADGGLYSWGENDYGQLGLGVVGSAGYVPQAIPTLGGVTAVAATAQDVYALTSDGTVSSWGYNGHHSLGAAPADDRATGTRSVPAPVVGLDHVTAIAAGGGSAYAVTADGAVHVWGVDVRAADDSGTATPLVVDGLPPVTAVAGGASSAYALARDGSVWAWGSNQYGVLGTGGDDGQATTPVRVPGLQGVVAITAGLHTAYAVTSDGRVQQWGEIEDPVRSTTPTPVPVPGLTGVTAIAASSTAAYAVTSDGTVHAWGFTQHGAMGDGSVTNARTDPVTISGLTGAVGVAGTYSGAVVLTGDGVVHTWGIQTLGNGTADQATTPVTATGPPRVASVWGGSTGSDAFAIAGPTPAAPAPAPTPPPVDYGALFALLLALLAFFLAL